MAFTPIRKGGLVSVQIDGLDEFLLDISKLPKEAKNVSRKMIRKELVPLRTEMRKYAPMGRTGKLRSSIKTSATSRKVGQHQIVGGKVEWGGKGSATAVRKAREQQGGYGSYGGRPYSEAMISEAWYVYIVAAGHIVPSGVRVPANTWAKHAISDIAPEIRRNVDRVLRAYIKSVHG